ncbi:MAG: M15 family metallopeptidase [Candidatus Paceibacterota bacterium]
MKIENLKQYIPLLAVLLILFVILAYGWVRLGMYKAHVSNIEERAAIEKEGYETRIQNLEKELEESKERIQTIGEELVAAENKYLSYDDTIRGLSGIVGDLDKLARTDEELLQKYSKVYFLNEHYVPENLSIIDPEYTYNRDREYEVHSNVWPRLKALLDEAEDKNLELKVISAFRSFGTQAGLKSSYTVTYGEGTANQFSADQGYSEHQLGTAIDFTTPEVGASFSGFEDTEEYTWLQENAHKYGFVLSYPEDNSYYKFEPWHWRYVGVELATKLYEDGLHFYDLSQREIDKYLISIFD